MKPTAARDEIARPVLLTACDGATGPGSTAGLYRFESTGKAMIMKTLFSMEAFSAYSMKKVS
jgi:hypothetical protein